MTRSTASQSNAGGPWTEDLTAYVVRHWGEGQSSGQLVQMVRKTFGVSVSRSAICGKMHRLGKRANPIGRSEARRIRESATARRNQAVQALRSPVSAKPKPVAAPVPPTVEPIRLMARSQTQCAWPIGRPDRPANQMCCGASVAEGVGTSLESYCAWHGKTALNRNHRVGKPSAKELTRALRRYV